jgi:hypothetical protein
MTGQKVQISNNNIYKQDYEDDVTMDQYKWFSQDHKELTAIIPKTSQKTQTILAPYLQKYPSIIT